MQKRVLSLKKFLSLAKFVTKSSFLITRKFPINFILGNESADPDSIFGAISLAYLLFTDQNTAFPHRKSDFKGYLTGFRNKMHIPMVGIEQKCLGFRFECTWLMKEYGVDPGSLVMMDKIDLKGVLKKGQAEVTLYDHNIPSPSQNFLKPYITNILDHHVDKTRFYYPKNQKINKQIELTGSASTLLINRFLPQIFKGDLHPDENILHLIRAVLIFDTFDFYSKLKGKRWIGIDLKTHN